MRIVLIILVATFICSCSSGLQVYYPLDSNRDDNNHHLSVSGNEFDDRPPSEPGKCYAKAITSDQLETNNDTLGIFGINEDIPQHLLQEVEYRPETTEWVKRKADKNCLSSDPNDCMVWCLQTTPAVYGIPIVSMDTTTAEPMKYIVIPDKVSMIEGGGHTVWTEVLCEKDITKRLLQSVHTALEERGYNSGVFPKGRLASKDLKAALKQFQKANFLKMGQLSIETLEALGVYY